MARCHRVYTPRETILFHASIRDNLGRSNNSAWEPEIRRAHTDDFIGAWPEGFNKIIGDQGVKLSGGQRQRLGIARALRQIPFCL